MIKPSLKDLTFLIPIRIDSHFRLQNLITSTEYLLKNFETNIIILEADKAPNSSLNQLLSSKIRTIFIEDHNIVFHRTKYINKLTRLAETELVAIWDADVIVSPKQILASVLSLKNDKIDFVFPYDGRFVDTGFEERASFVNTMNIEELVKNIEKMQIPYTNFACGGGFLANKACYLEVGLENENFFGWGQEDGERVKRWEILDRNFARVPGPLFHLSHSRGLNSAYRSEENRKEFISEFLRICKMSKAQLQEEILTWTSN